MPKLTDAAVQKMLGDDGALSNWGNDAAKENNAALNAETPRKRAARLSRVRSASRRRRESAQRKRAASLSRRRREFEAEEARRARPSYGVSTNNVRRENRSSFRRDYGRNPTSYIRSRRRRQGRPSRSRRSSSSRTRKARRGPRHARGRSAAASRSHHPMAAALGHRGHSPAAARRGRSPAKPRPGKFMRECRADCTEEGCARHKTTGNCKFVHKDEPEYAMLRPDQKAKKGGYVPPSPAPLSTVNTYTSWPGGIDPSARLYDQQKML